MNRTHSIFVEVTTDELLEILHAHFKRTGALRGIPNDADRQVDEEVSVCVEYSWTEDAIVAALKRKP